MKLDLVRHCREATDALFGLLSVPAAGFYHPGLCAAVGYEAMLRECGDVSSVPAVLTFEMRYLLPSDCDLLAAVRAVIAKSKGRMKSQVFALCEVLAKGAAVIGACPALRAVLTYRIPVQ